MKNGKILSLALALLMLLSLAACQQPAASSAPAVSSAASQAEPDPAAAIDKDVVWLTRFHGSYDKFSSGEDPNSYWLSGKIAELTGYTVQFETLPKSDPENRISLVLASGSTPDLITIQNKALLFSYAAQGVFEPLDAYIDAYMPNYKAVVDESLRNSLSINGSIFAVGTPGDKVVIGLGGRRDILATAGVEAMPQTLEEFYITLQAIRDNTDLMPFGASGSSSGALWTSLGPIAGAFGVANKTMVKDGVLKLSWVEPEFKEFLTFVKQLLDEGLMDPEFAVTNDMKDKVAAQKLALYAMPWWDGISLKRALEPEVDGLDIGYLPHPSKDGVAGSYAYPPLATYVVIPAAARNKEGAAAFIDNIFTQEYITLCNHGIEGETYEMLDGEVSFLDTDLAKEFQSVSQYYLIYKTQEEKLFEYRTAGHLEFFEDLRDNITFSPEYTLQAPPVEAYDSVIIELENYAYENAIKFLMGARDLSEFDAYVSEMENRGATTAIKAMDAWFQTSGLN